MAYTNADLLSVAEELFEEDLGVTADDIDRLSRYQRIMMGALSNICDIKDSEPFDEDESKRISLLILSKLSAELNKIIGDILDDWTYCIILRGVLLVQFRSVEREIKKDPISTLLESKMPYRRFIMLSFLLDFIKYHLTTVHGMAEKDVRGITPDITIGEYNAIKTEITSRLKTTSFFKELIIE